MYKATECFKNMRGWLPLLNPNALIVSFKYTRNSIENCLLNPAFPYIDVLVLYYSFWYSHAHGKMTHI